MCYKRAMKEARPPELPTQDSRGVLHALKRMSMAEIQVLVALSSSRSMSDASVILRTTQSSISQHVRSLEEKLAMTLFERHRRGLVPTPRGAVLLRCAASIRGQFVAAADELASIGEGRPRLRIGCQPAASAGILALAIGRFAAIDSSCVVTLTEERVDLLIEKLRGGYIDLFVGRLTEDVSDFAVRHEVLIDEGAMIICARAHPLTRRSRLQFRDLLASEWVLPQPGSPFHTQIVATLARQELALPTARVETRSMIGIVPIVANSSLLGFVQRSLLLSSPTPSVATLPIALEWAPAPIGVMYRTEISRNVYASRFIDCLRVVAASDNSAPPHRARFRAGQTRSR